MADGDTNNNNTLDNTRKDVDHVLNGGIDDDTSPLPQASALDDPSSQTAEPSSLLMPDMSDADADSDDNPDDWWDGDFVLEQAHQLISLLADDSYGTDYSVRIVACRRNVDRIVDKIWEVAARAAEHAGRQAVEWRDIRFAIGMLKLLSWPGEYDEY